MNRNPRQRVILSIMSSKLLAAFGLSLAAVAFGVIVSRPAVAGPVQDTVISKIGVTDIRSVLTELKLEYKESKDSDDLVVFDIKVDDTEINLYQYESEDKKVITSLTISSGYDLEKGMDAKPINKFNYEHRFVKGYLDEENDPFLVQDVWVANGITREALKRNIGQFMTALPDFEKTISSADLAQAQPKSLR